MAKDPAFLFYPNDWLGGTLGMTLEQKGAYIELLMLQFNRGHMTSHMIAHTVGQVFDGIKEKFIQDANGCWYNVRLEEEKDRRKRFTDSRKNNKLGINQYKNNFGHMTSHMENENSISINSNSKLKKHGKSENGFSGNFKAQGEELFAERARKRAEEEDRNRGKDIEGKE